MIRAMKVLFLACLWLAAAHPLHASAKVRVVTTTAAFAEIVRQVGGDRVAVKAVAPPKFNVHYVQPRPSDVRDVRKADLYVSSGIDFEAWSDPLVEAAGRPEIFRGGTRHVGFSAGVRLLEVPEPSQLSRAAGDMHLDGNPHYHMDPRNARPMAETLAAKFKEVDPEGADRYDENLATFLGKLETKLSEWEAVKAELTGKEIASYHKDIVYFADFLGLQSTLFLEPKPGVPPGPRELAALEREMKARSVKAVVQPSYYGRSLSEAVAAKTGARVVVVAQNPGEVPGTDGFFEWVDYNVNALREVLKG